jgi:hypothetical protein
MSDHLADLAQHLGVMPTSRRCRSTRTALFLRTELSYDDWREVGERLLTVADSSAWWVGDWLLFGQRTYADRYEIALARTGFDYQTLRNYAWVASRFEPSRRRGSLSFSHHAEVAALEEDEQDAWLRRALVKGWSRNTLRNELRNQLGGSRVAARTAIRLQVPPQRRALWEAAAEASGYELDAWIEVNLDEAAASALADRGAAAAA